MEIQRLEREIDTDSRDLQQKERDLSIPHVASTVEAKEYISQDDLLFARE